MRKVCVAVLVGMTVCSIAWAADLQWYGGVTETIGLPSGGGDPTGWEVAIYQDGGNGTIDAILTGGVSAGDDTFLLNLQPSGNDMSGGTPISWFRAGTTVANGLDIFTVVFDNSSRVLAGNYVVVDDGLYTANQGATDPPPDYDAGGAATGEWQPVPEPSSLALMGLGVAALVARRFRKK